MDVVTHYLFAHSGGIQHGKEKKNRPVKPVRKLREVLHRPRRHGPRELRYRRLLPAIAKKGSDSRQEVL